MRPSHISYFFLGSFLVTIFFLQWWPARTIPFGSGGQLPVYPWWVWVGLGMMGLMVMPFTAGRRPALSGIFGIMIGLVVVSHTTHVSTPQTPDFYTGSAVAIRGIIADDPDRRALKTNYIVDAELLKTGMKTMRVTGRVLVTLRVGHRPFAYGDEVIVQGMLEEPESDDDFRYDRYLSVKNIYSLMRDPRVETTGEQYGNAVLAAIYRFKNALEERIGQVLPEPHASLLGGLLLGSRGAMPQSLVQDFKTTGLTHIVAISGYNITMLITMMGTLLFWLPLKWRFWPSVVLIISFTILTGASASAVRAAVMGILGLLALQLNRLQTTRLTVLWSAFFMLAWNPKQLWYDAGFQLSFLALIGILEISPVLKPYMRKIPEMFGLQESLTLTLSAQMLASAWICFLFGQLSLIAPVSNLLAPPVVPYAMLFGTVSILLGWIWMPLGQAAAMIAWLPLQWITGVAHVLGAMPYAVIQIEGLSSFWIVLYFALLAFWVTLRQAQGNGQAVTRHSAAPSFSRSIDPVSPPRRAASAGIGMHAR